MQDAFDLDRVGLFFGRTDKIFAGDLYFLAGKHGFMQGSKLISWKVMGDSWKIGGWKKETGNR